MTQVQISNTHVFIFFFKEAPTHLYHPSAVQGVGTEVGIADRNIPGFTKVSQARQGAPGSARGSLKNNRKQWGSGGTHL